jgi:predicted nucleic acid-binding protein
LEIADLMAYVVGLVTLIEAPASARFVPDDSGDDVIVACAVAAKAAYIISGDRHLRALQRVADIPVVTPQVFLQRVPEAPAP